VERGDMWFVCWPGRWGSVDGEEGKERRGARKGIRESGERREEKWNGAGVEGRS